jgi:hypothetical protein
MKEKKNEKYKYISILNILYTKLCRNIFHENVYIKMMSDTSPTFVLEVT